MAPVVNGRILFKSYPKGYPELGKDLVYDESQTIDLEAPLEEGGYITKTLCLAMDPFLRGLMNPQDPNHYAPMFHLGKTIWGFGIVVVIKSEREDVKVGDHLYSGTTQFEQYTINNDTNGITFLKNEYNLPWRVFLGPVGMPGKTAQVGWKLYAEPKKGQTAFVSTGAGQVGSVVIQLAKQAGMKVIASAGSSEKVAYMKELGADVAFNYKDTQTKDVLKKEGPIDVYWDNVGGETLDAALANAARFARFIECGSISDYNEAGPGVKNMSKVFERDIHMNGFVILHIEEPHNEWFYSEVPKQVASGELKYNEDLYHGLDKAPQAMFDVQKGTNKAKVLIIVADE